MHEHSRARQLLEDARKKMEAPLPPTRNQQDDQRVSEAVVSNFLYKGFKYRVDQVLAGKPQTGGLSAELLAELDEIYKKGVNGPSNNPYKLSHYVISRMREKSDILEPHEKLEPYSEYTKGSDPLRRELWELYSVRDPRRLAERIRKLHRDGPQGRSLTEVQFLVLHETIPLAPRVGEAFTVELLQHVPAALAEVSTIEDSVDWSRKLGDLMNRALFIAGHYGRTDIVKQLIDDFSKLIHGKKKDEERFRLINAVGGECLRSLKRLGLRDEIDRFFSRLHIEVLIGASPAELRKRYAARPELWSQVLQTLLNLAGGWLTFGLDDRAKPALDMARSELLSTYATKFHAKDYTPLACAYVTALGFGPPEEALVNITALYSRMDRNRIVNSFTTAPYYSRFHLNLVEQTIRAIGSDEFALGAGGRKWLDDDEYIVRRRIHSDMRHHLERSGL
jgi:hypothetical protein